MFRNYIVTILGQPTDRHADIWSIGVVLYEMLAGRVPFPGQTEAACAIVHTDQDPLTAVRSGLPLDIDRIIAKALRKDPRDRHQNADDLMVDLRHLSGQPAAASRSCGKPKKNTRSCGDRRVSECRPPVPAGPFKTPPGLALWGKEYDNVI